ncbi:hypothetical protein [Egicoccus sp. AB-alg2]|uniref:hypothetical protein n=1 Tax=Egicoccus sp. AB-alg2 TaxID=3242693 RepID=UPI00359CD9B3
MSLSDLDEVFDGALVWGMELDPRYRVLAVTLEPTAERYPWGDADDRRVQLLVHPVSTVLASFRSVEDGRRLLHTFTDAQLVDVAGAFGGAAVAAPLFGRPEPRPGEWSPQFSMEGRSSAADGTRHTLTVQLRADDLELDLFARFDEVEVKGPDGTNLDLDARRASD